MSEWNRIAGPVTRPDGKVVKIYERRNPRPDACPVRVDNGYTGSEWNRDEVEMFGGGKFKKGISVMMGLLVTASEEQLRDSRRYPPLPGSRD